MVFWFFGLPGSGKDFCAEQMHQLFDVPHIDADDYIDTEYRKKVKEATLTDADRLKKLERIINHIKQQKKDGIATDFCVADSLPSYQSREFVESLLPGEVQLVHVNVDQEIHKKRINARQDHFLTGDVLETYKKTYWQPLNKKYATINNNSDNTADLLTQLHTLHDRFCEGENCTKKTPKI